MTLPEEVAGNKAWGEPTRRASHITPHSSLNGQGWARQHSCSSVLNPLQGSVEHEGQGAEGGGWVYWAGTSKWYLPASPVGKLSAGFEHQQIRPPNTQATGAFDS